MFVEPVVQPIIHQIALETNEAKIWSTSTDSYLSFHGPKPFEHHSHEMHGGIRFDLWYDTECSIPRTLEMRVDWYGSLGQLIKRYLSLGLAFPITILLWLFHRQLSQWMHEGKIKYHVINIKKTKMS